MAPALQSRSAADARQSTRARARPHVSAEEPQGEYAGGAGLGAIGAGRPASTRFHALQISTQAMCVTRWRHRVALQRATQVPRGGF